LLEGSARLPRPFDVVLVEDLSRLTREADKTITIFKDLEDRGIRLIGVADGFDSENQSALMIASPHCANVT
jgi:DNA invertase Pin-like site-specific DNA recombinase